MARTTVSVLDGSSGKEYEFGVIMQASVIEVCSVVDWDFPDTHIFYVSCSYQH